MERLHVGCRLSFRYFCRLSVKIFDFRGLLINLSYFFCPYSEVFFFLRFVGSQYY